jgi:hypothetical protein
MRRTIMLTVLALSLAALPAVLAQDAKDPIVAGAGSSIPDSLEKLLETALKHNPEVLLAETGVRQAQAVLNQTRLDVAQRVAGLYHERKNLQRMKAELGKQYAEAQAGHAVGAMSQSQLRELGLAAAEAEAKFAQTEAEIRYTLGVGGSPRAFRTPFFRDSTSPALSPTQPRTTPRAPIEEAHGYRNLLGTMKVSWVLTPISKVVGDLRNAAGDDLAFVLHSTIDPEYKVTLTLPGEVTLKNVLAALTDYFHGGEVCFVFREYGVLVTDTISARRLQGATIPAGIALQPK